MRTCTACAIGLTLLLARPAAAQLSPARERAELAVRLRAFEAAWEVADEAGRKRALAILPKASTQFLGLNLKESGRTLDLARYALTHKEEPSVAWVRANSMGITPGPRLVDTVSAGNLSADIQPFYPAASPDGMRVIGELTGGPRPITCRLEVTVSANVPGRVEAVESSDDASRNLLILIAKGGGVFAPTEGADVCRPITRLAVPDLAARLKVLETPPKTLPPIETASLLDYAALLKQFTNGEPTDSEWLTPKVALHTAEAIRRDPPGGYFRATPGVACEFWLTVPTGAATTPCRVRVPAVPAGQKVPVVVALHGVGGSEHQFPEAYGAGCLADAARDAGYALVCPRGGVFGAPPVPEILAALAERFPIDTDRVHLVGHSLGASQAAELAQRPGANYQTVTLLAGGGRVRDAARLKATRLFLAVGDADFAVKSTRNFQKALLAAGVAPTYREYPGVEHLTVVRHATADVAKFWAAK